MRTSFHHQPEAQHPNFPLSVSWQADYPIFRDKRTFVRLTVGQACGFFGCSLCASSIAPFCLDSPWVKS